MRTGPVPALSPEQMRRFFSKVLCGITKDSCWTWTGAIGANRYGKFRISDRIYEAHRVMYAIRWGQVPAGLVIDHRGPDGFGCKRSCVNWRHLEAVTPRVNAERQLPRGERTEPITEPEQRALLAVLEEV